MADNVSITAGSGTVIATDDIGGVQYQRVKINMGSDGERADVDNGQQTMANSLPVVVASDQTAVAVSPAASETHIGETTPNATTVDFTLSLDTNPYHAGDVLAATQEIAGCLRVNDGTSELVSLVVLDEDDQAAAAMTFWFFRSNVALGAENGLPSITDANARALIGQLTVPASAWVDLGGSKVAVMPNVGLLLTGAGGSTSLWMAVTTAGTPTQTASGITGHLTFIRY